MDPFLVLIRLQLEFLQGDFAILVAVLVLEHVPYGFLRVLTWHEASFALSNLSLDEGGELGVWTARGRVGVRVLPEQLWVALARNPRGRPASEDREERSQCSGPEQDQGSGRGNGPHECWERQQGPGTQGTVTGTGAGTWTQVGWWARTTFLLDATMQVGFC